MSAQRHISKGLAAMAAALAASLATAAAAPILSTESQVSEYFVRGDAAVSESTRLRKGLRLAAWDAREQADATRVAVAAAVYFFQVPLAARAVSIEVAYQADPAARNKKVAGFLFVRNRAIEQQFAGQNTDGKRPVEEPAFFGNTYLLPADQTKVTITLPAENHVIDGVLEVHLSAGAGQVFDAQYVQVVAFGAEVAVPIQHVEPARYVPDPYAYTYYYYYAGPCYYPYATYYAAFQIASFDPIFWRQWHLRRAAYYIRHGWCYRPARFVHRPFITIYQPVFIVRPPLRRYRDQWYRRCFRVDPDRLRRGDFDRLVRRRRDFLPPERLAERFRVARQLVADGQAAERELRHRLGHHYRDREAFARAAHSLRAHYGLDRAAQTWAAINADRRPRITGPARHESPAPRIGPSRMLGSGRSHAPTLASPSRAIWQQPRRNPAVPATTVGTPAARHPRTQPDPPQRHQPPAPPDSIIQSSRANPQPVVTRSQLFRDRLRQILESRRRAQKTYGSQDGDRDSEKARGNNGRERHKQGDGPRVAPQVSRGALSSGEPENSGRAREATPPGKPVFAGPRLVPRRIPIPTTAPPAPPKTREQHRGHSRNETVAPRPAVKVQPRPLPTPAPTPRLVPRIKPKPRQPQPQRKGGPASPAFKTHVPKVGSSAAGAKIQHPPALSPFASRLRQRLNARARAIATPPRSTPPSGRVTTPTIAPRTRSTGTSPAAVRTLPQASRGRFAPSARHSPPSFKGSPNSDAQARRAAWLEYYRNRMKMKRK